MEIRLKEEDYARLLQQLSGLVGQLPKEQQFAFSVFRTNFLSNDGIHISYLSETDQVVISIDTKLVVLFGESLRTSFASLLDGLNNIEKAKTKTGLAFSEFKQTLSSITCQ